MSRTTHRALILAALATIASAAVWALAPTSGANYAVQDASITAPAAQSQGTNYTMLSRIGPGPQRIAINQPTSVSDWQVVGDK